MAVLASLAAVLAAYQPAHHAFGPFADHLEDLRYELEPLAAAGVLHKSLGLFLSELVGGEAAACTCDHRRLEGAVDRSPRSRS